MRHFGCDACVEIVDKSGFSNAIFYALKKDNWIKDADRYGNPCTYGDRTAKMESSDEWFKIYWLKEKKFEHQDEYRIVFYPPNPSHTLSQG